MNAVVYRRNNPEGHGSWRPRSLTDMRGARFPDEYHEHLVLAAESIADVFDQYESKLGDIIVLGDGDEREVFAAAPFGWETVKFGREWRSPD
jgi:hypothetical protein